MTGKVVNLSKARKSRAKAQDKVRADANAAKFGRTKGEKATERAVADKAKRDLDGHERE